MLPINRVPRNGTERCGRQEDSSGAQMCFSLVDISLFARDCKIHREG